MTLSQAISKRITELCNSNEYNTTSLAKRAGLNESTVRAIIDGRSQSPQIGNLYYICVALNISLSDFFKSDLFDIENIDDN